MSENEGNAKRPAPEALSAVPSTAQEGTPPVAVDHPPAKLGIECRRCGCRHFEVLYTRAASSGRIMRRRACRHCGKRFTTYEKRPG